MIVVLVHNGLEVVAAVNERNDAVIGVQTGRPILETIKEVAIDYNNTLVVWCHEQLVGFLNYEGLEDIFHHKRILASYNIGDDYYIPKEIGYIERSFFIKINKAVSYPTWLMSSLVGGVHTQVLQGVIPHMDGSRNFSHFLNALTILAMPQGLFCYSEPKLLTSGYPTDIRMDKMSTPELFKFVKQYYKWVWVIFLMGCYVIYEKSFPLWSLVRSFFYNRIEVDFGLERIKISSSRSIIDKSTVDVIIPTIGRKKYLYDVLGDLSKQTHVPKRVIIVEQNPDVKAVSELDYISNEDWPFEIDHTYTHQAGVCNARNIALSKVQSEWTLLGDDDNRFDTDLIEKLLAEMDKQGAQAAMTVYLQPGEQQTFMHTGQTSIFGAGNSLIKSSLLDEVRFDKRYEFNYGEDTDFGMQIRNTGQDVLFCADIKITHLKAPMGGYRTKQIQLWDNDIVLPKPSPTIQLMYQTYFTKTQLLGYKLLLGIRSFKHSETKHPMKYIKRYKNQWERSEYWAKKL